MMGLPHQLDRARTDQLRTTEPPPLPESAPRPPGSLARRTVRWVLRRVERRLVGETRSALDAAVRRLDALERATGSYDEFDVRGLLTYERQKLQDERLEEASRQQARISEEAHLAAVNSELLKGEVRELGTVIEQLGFAIAPGAGLEGARPRLAELRERLNGLDRRVRHMSAALERAGSPGSGAATGRSDGDDAAARPEPVAETGPSPSTLFDYVGFERRFRGDAEEVAETLWSRYGPLLVEHGPVLDLGCGPGQLISRLNAHGVDAVGVDLDPSMVAEAQALGLTVHRQDAAVFLEGQPAGSFGAIVATQLVEHLQLEELMRLLELCVSRLRPGGILVAETPNPGSLIVLGNSYILDPTHVWPLHPSLLVFLLESVGFREVRLNFYSPAEDYQLAPLKGANDSPFVEEVNAAFDQLNRVLFGPQDYAAIATTPE